MSPTLFRKVSRRRKSTRPPKSSAAKRPHLSERPRLRRGKRDLSVSSRLRRDRNPRPLVRKLPANEVSRCNVWSKHAAVFAAMKRLILSRQKLWSEYNCQSNSALRSTYQMNESPAYACYWKLAQYEAALGITCSASIPTVSSRGAIYLFPCSFFHFSYFSTSSSSSLKVWDDRKRVYICSFFLSCSKNA